MHGAARCWTPHAPPRRPQPEESAIQPASKAEVLRERDAGTDPSRQGAPPDASSGADPRALTGAWRWLDAHEGEARFGFLCRDGTGLLGAGVDEVLDGEDLGTVLDAARERGGTWFVGGRFDPGSEARPWWRPFGRARAWRPRHVRRLPSAPVAARPRSPLRAREQAPAAGRYPDARGWQDVVEAALRRIDEGTLDKVVLARGIVEPTSTGPLTWLEGPLGPREMAFLVEPEPGVAFAGLTPELLFDRRGRRVHSEALAGTDRDTPEGRARLGGSEKIAREHALVVEAVAQALGPHCTRLVRSPLQLAPTGRMVHRLVTFDGTLHDATSDAGLAASLHPTPAVAGTPRAPAVSFIRDREPMDRGWYAGPVGLVEPGRTTLAVALRCGLWFGTARIAYAGAGLVAGSQATAEWEETRLKSLVVRQR
jgi:hypothetical protein